MVVHARRSQEQAGIMIPKLPDMFCADDYGNRGDMMDIRAYPATSVAPFSVAPVFNRWKTQVANLCHSYGIDSKRMPHRSNADVIRTLPIVRLHQFLQRHHQQLGPTQWAHLTTHSSRVSELAVRLGQVLRLEPAELRRLCIAGLMHDVGKLLIPEQLLAKPSKLTDEERRIINRHAVDGAVIARLFGVDRQSSEFIRYHHQWFNAPNDRMGVVPLGARVLAVADAFVTMVAERPYQAARPISAALEKLRRYSSTQFDPIVVAAAPFVAQTTSPHFSHRGERGDRRV